MPSQDDTRSRNVRYNTTFMSLKKYRLTTSGLLFLGFPLLYFCLYQYYLYTSYRDPTSYFFDPSHAYTRIYSAKRIKEAQAYVTAANTGSQSAHKKNETPLMCVGVATVARRGEQYVGLTVGSLLADLMEEERSQIVLSVLFGHTEPAKHPSFEEDWTRTLPDNILTYPREGSDLQLLQTWEQNGWYRNKTIYDYRYMLADCYASGAKYITIVEDDILAAEGWFARTVQALSDVEANMAKRSGQRWLYLRLFYADDLLGWNSEEWARYLLNSFLLWAAATTGILAMKKRFRKHFDSVTIIHIAFLSGICVPALIALCFMAGRQTIWPLPVGVNEMNRYGCCSQGMVFPRSIIPDLLEKAVVDKDWLVDMMMEKIADKEGYIRWALVPSVLQHIGATSSKGYGFDDKAKQLWNFRFEESYS